MTATAVSDVSTAVAAAAGLGPRSTLSLPAGAVLRPELSAAEVVVFDEARADLPRPYVTSEEVAAEARRAKAHEREYQSRERGRTILRHWRSGDPGAVGDAMLARPHKDVPIAFLSEEVLEAALTRQFVDNHLIDRMWDNGQLNDWQYATANKLLQLADDAGLLASKVALIGRTGAGVPEMSDGMAKARGLWNRLMAEIGYPGDELLTSLCQEQLQLRGLASRAEALTDGLRHLARHWRIEIA